MADAKMKPAYEAFAVDGEGDKAFWTKIGAAWPHDDGKGFNLQFVALPLTGRIVLRSPKPADKKAKAKSTSE